ncbi:hypothetical protein MIND_00691800 [Mycena indigotica]|uniref:Chromatin target of PRMT1 protein C-terminal domain-containing protein n=1 Tax=Mycena indigotica TaxID=2126181 RepID=A0A8H6SNW4_9AGAR|nr:uncharacterized protein MIND_00691800 [Mycena indigotica]KAF7301270.1 hypothetical protein MIND_00691800 [Mycena indigotica]
MDTSPDDLYPAALSYDNDTAYEEQLPTAEEQASLAKRIGQTKVYLLSESVARAGSKRKHEEDSAMDDEVDMEEDTTSRGNALLLGGSPIASLPTAGLFAYATHFDSHPLGLEWVDDEHCVFVFDSKAAARAAYRLLQKHITEEPDTDGFVTAKPIPVAIWPPEDRINRSLGKGEGLKGVIRMRWALPEDVKKRGARQQSQFYKKHGWGAGKESNQDPTNLEYPASKRRRRGSSVEIDREQVRAALDAELDEFIRADDEPEPEPEPEQEPVSKMRSDFIASDGRTLLQRTSVLRLQPNSLESRLTAPLPRRVRGTMYADALEDRGHRTGDDDSGRLRQEVDAQRSDSRRNGTRSRNGGSSRRDGTRRNGRGSERERHSRNERPTVTREDLDAELDAFLEAKD